MGKSTAEPAFWEKPLAQLTTEEWESLCDGCGRCCLKKLEDEDTGEIHFTNVVCRFFDQKSHRCGCYSTRTEKVPDCLDVRAMDIETISWMPDTCAYRLRSEGKPLPTWHPLLSGSRDLMDEAGISVGGRVLSEEFVHDDGYEEHLIRWVTS